MYCPSCGKDVNADLSYCNHCGARIAAGNDLDPNALSETSFHVLIGALLTIPIVGIGLILAIMVVMKRELGFGEDPVLAVVMVSLILFLAAEAGVIWLMLTRTKKRKVVAPAGEKRGLGRADVTEKVLTEGQPLEFSAPAASVTDHTTRTLDPVRRDPADR